MKRDAVVRSTKSLVEKKLVTKHKEGTAGQEECWYSLVVENPAEFSNPIDDSNNSNQSFKKTPPSLFRKPTKETLTKETNTNVNVPKSVERNVCINESLKKIGGLDDKAKEFASRFASEHEIQDALEACRYQEKKKKIVNPSSFFVGTLKNKMEKRR